MKLKYKISLLLFFVEIIVFYIMSSYNIKIESAIGSILCVVLFFMPVQFLLYSLGKDVHCSTRKRKYFKIFFWFLNYCVLSLLIDVVIVELK